LAAEKMAGTSSRLPWTRWMEEDLAASFWAEEEAVSRVTGEERLVGLVRRCERGFLAGENGEGCAGGDESVNDGTTLLAGGSGDEDDLW